LETEFKSNLRRPQVVVEREYCYGYNIRVAVRGALCSDGVQRYAELTTLEPDTYFSHPARVKVRGRWVKGFISVCDSACDPREGLYLFTAYTYGPTADILPEDNIRYYDAGV
jgi:hypothetical protein